MQRLHGAAFPDAVLSSRKASGNTKAQLPRQSRTQAGAGFCADLLSVGEGCGIKRFEKMQAYKVSARPREGTPRAFPASFFPKPSYVWSCFTKVEQYRLDHHWSGRRDECFKQRPFERQQSTTIRSCSFRKQGHRPVFGNCRAKFGNLVGDILLVCTVDKYRPVELRQPANDRPTAYAILRDKSRAGDSGYDRNIMPRQMIGDIENILAERLSIHLYPRTQSARRNAQKKHRPRGR